MQKKFKLTNETKTHFGTTLHRIKALVSFGDVCKGDKGGFVETDANLSHNGNAWVCGNAEVYGDAEVYGNAEVCGGAEVYGNAKVCGNAEVCGNAKVYGDAEVSITPTCIFGLMWSVVISDKHISIGCQTRTLSFWKRASKKTIAAMDRNATIFWEDNKAAIILLATKHQSST